MAYFSNGTEGCMYLDRWCFHCRNWKDRRDGRGEGCPIWDVHLAYNGDQGARGVLDMLIPMSEDGIYPQRCVVYEEDSHLIAPPP